MPSRVRGCTFALLAVTALLASPAAAERKAPPAKKPAEPELPQPEVRARVIAPSAQGRWTFRIENEGTAPVRVPADVRLLRITVESGDTMSKKARKAVSCSLPAGLRPEGFPDRNALLLGPGDAYLETFDPRLFCFGKNAKALEGGALVRARYGWDAPKDKKKVGPPYAVESTELPATVAPVKELVVPPLVLSYLPPKPDADADADAKTKDKAGDGTSIVDENNAKIELRVPEHIETVSGPRMTMTLTATNTGHRSTPVVIRSRMVGFVVDGPDGVARCDTAGPTKSYPRESYQTLEPGGSTSLALLVEEACGRSLFRRPGLYKVLPRLRLVEDGAEVGLTAWTGTAIAKEPTLVRVATGPDPFYPRTPRVLRAPKADEEDKAP